MLLVAGVLGFCRFCPGSTQPCGCPAEGWGPCCRWQEQAPLYTHILTFQLGRAVGNGSRSSEELDRESCLHTPDERNGDPRPLHWNHPGHRRHPAPVLKEPAGIRGKRELKHHSPGPGRSDRRVLLPGPMPAPHNSQKSPFGCSLPGSPVVEVVSVIVIVEVIAAAGRSRMTQVNYY